MMNQFLERLALAWAILWNRDSPLVEHVAKEIGRVDRDVVLNCVNIARVFSIEGHSGGSASIVIPWIQKALSWDVVAPLTGEADEWMDVSELSGRPLWQNRRCGRVFKEEDGSCYDVEGIVFVEKNGASYTQYPGSRTVVTFPYQPKREYKEAVEMP
jgi:hypothetical protein